MMLSDLYRAALQRTPEKTAIDFQGRSITYAALHDAVRQDAAALASLGVGYGDRVALFMGNRPELLTLDLACFSLGAVAVPLNARFQTDEIVHACLKSTPRVLIAAADRAAKVDGLETRAPSLEHVLLLDGTGDTTGAGGVGGAGDGADPGRDGPGPSGSGSGEDGGDDSGSWAQALAAARPYEETPLPDDPGHPALIMFTSGSTGKPKGVTHTHGTVLSLIRSRVATQRLAESDVALIGTLICHVAGSLGLAFPTLYAGGRIVLLESFDPGVWLVAVGDHRPTRALLLPTQMLDALEHEAAPAADLGSLLEIEVAGGVVTHHLRTLFKATTGRDVQEVYGLTECEGVSMQRYWEDARSESIGRPRANVEVRLVDRDGADVPAGRAGEIWVASDSVMVGYWEDPEPTAAAFAERWFKTGDLGRLNEDGSLSFVGRIKEIIIKGGSNVTPDEVEEVLDDHPAVECSAVVGAPDQRLGEVIHAFVELKDGSRKTVGVEELRSYAADKLAEYKVPDRWTILDALPRNDVGKLDYAALHVMAAGGGD